MGVKALRPGIESAEIVARFDAGASEAGNPYFVMELVRRVPITEYCDSHELGTRVALRNRHAAALEAEVR